MLLGPLGAIIQVLWQMQSLNKPAVLLQREGVVNNFSISYIHLADTASYHPKVGVYGMHSQYQYFNLFNETMRHKLMLMKDVNIVCKAEHTRGHHHRRTPN